MLADIRKIESVIEAGTMGMVIKKHPRYYHIQQLCSNAYGRLALYSESFEKVIRIVFFSVTCR